jgi:L-aspartate oxidase
MDSNPVESKAGFDVVVVGSGAAGLAAALQVAELGGRVAVLTAGELLAGSSPRAQGGVAAAVGADDAATLHAADTLAVGAGLNDASAVEVLTREARSSVQWLLDEGIGFEHDLGLEAGHARRRILHAGGGATGQVLTRALVARARMHRRITLVDHAPVWALEVQSGRVVGARVGRRTVAARATILASGGYAALWGRTTNAPETRGTGLFLAWQAGATLADLEFVQFHPTALDLPGRPPFLLSEALRGEGGRLVDERGHDVVDPLLPRDIVARALHRHLQARGPVYLSLQDLDPGSVHGRFARIARKLREFGLDLARDRLPVAPAAHYCMGGVRTDTWARTSVPGLYAAGEVACSGAQGANRLASNSLLECLVFGARAAEAALLDTAPGAPPAAVRPLNDIVRTEPGDRTVIQAMAEDALGAVLDASVGVERTAARLGHLVSKLPAPAEAPSSGLLLASLIARAALLRRESRGAHYRADAPEPDPAWRGHILWRRGHAPVFEDMQTLPLV